MKVMKQKISECSRVAAGEVMHAPEFISVPPILIEPSFFFFFRLDISFFCLRLTMAMKRIVADMVNM